MYPSEICARGSPQTLTRGGHVQLQSTEGPLGKGRKRGHCLPAAALDILGQRAPAISRACTLHDLWDGRSGSVLRLKQIRNRCLTFICRDGGADSGEKDIPVSMSCRSALFQSQLVKKNERHQPGNSASEEYMFCFVAGCYRDPAEIKARPAAVTSPPCSAKSCYHRDVTPRIRV